MSIISEKEGSLKGPVRFLRAVSVIHAYRIMYQLPVRAAFVIGNYSRESQRSTRVRKESPPALPIQDCRALPFENGPAARDETELLV